MRAIKYIATTFIAIISMAGPLFATNFDVDFEDASTGFVTAGTNDQKIVYVKVNNPNGGGQSNSSITGMDFTPDVTLNSDVTSAKLYYTTTATFSTTTQLGSDDTDLSDGISFTFSQAINKGNTNHYFWLAYDVSSGASDCNTLNATQVSGDITTPATMTYTDNSSGSVTIGPGVGCWNYCTVNGTTSGTHISQVDFNGISRASAFDGYIHTGLSTTVQRTQSYTLSVQIYNPGSNNLYTAAWIDYNNDGDFSDAGENVMASQLTSVSLGTTTRSVSVSVGSAATLGTTRMRVVMKFNSTLVDACDSYTGYIDWEDYDIDIAAAPSNMSYSSSATTQTVTSSVNAGTVEQQVVGVEIVTAGTLSPLDLSSMDFSTSGTTSASDIENARLFSTGNSATFATTTQVGSTVASPSGSFTFSMTESLSEGTNYFWLTYDVVSGASGGNMIDASCTAIEVDGSFYVPSPSDPGSGRSIIAATNMVYTSSTTIQNTSPVPKNSADNHVVGIEVVVDGALNAFDVTNFSLTENSTSTADIENAKIYYTGLDDEFGTTNQFGSTVASPSGTYSISGTQTLQNGTNYFWVTYDTKAGATGGNSIDVNCNSITIDGNVETPTLTAPLGSRSIISGTPYFSTGNNDLTQLSSWNSERDGSGSAPASFSSSYSFWVQGGHSLTTSTTATIPYMYVEDGGYVTASYLISYTDMRIMSGGIYEQTALASSAGYISNFYIENNGTWIHNQTGYLPGNNRYFSPNSHQWFYQWGGGTFPSGTSWGNVLFNGTTVGNFDLRNVMNDIQGDWEWRKIGSGNYLWSGATETLDVGGDLIFSGGWFMGAGNGAGFGAPKNNQLTVNVSGDFIMSSGTFNDYHSGNNSAGTTLNIDGNVEITGGTWEFNESPGGVSAVNMTVGTADVNWEQSSSATVELPNTTIPSGKTVTMVGDELGDMGSSRTLTIENGGALYTEAFPVTGSGAIDVQSGSTLGLGSTYTDGALTSTAGQGNVQVTGTRTFNAGATYEYNGTANQETGDQLPTTITGGLTMNNAASNGTVTLTQNTTVTGNLTLTAGDLISTSSERLTIGSSSTISPVRGGTNSFVSGILDRVVNATSDFEVPIGSSPDDRWRPLTITPHDATSRTWTVEFIDEDPNTDLGSTFLSTDSIISVITYYYYDVTNVAADGADIDVKIWYQDSDLGVIDETGTVIGHWDSGNSWWDAFDLDDLAADWNRSTSNNWVQTTGGVNTFSPITVGGGGSVLPVELLAFNATCNNAGVTLEWATATEIRNSHFTIEHSTDGLNFEEIGIVYGAGTSNSVNHYTLTHDIPSGGVNYYKLFQTDTDGTRSYEGTVATRCAGVFDIISISPIPANNQLSVLMRLEEEGVVDITLHDMLGRILYSTAHQGNEGANQIKLDVSELAAGIYHLQLKHGDELIQRKIVKD